jgi:hypothetical protein
MSDSEADRDDCDFVALNRDNIAFTGTAHIERIMIRTKILPDPLEFPKLSIVHIRFKQLPYQPDDAIQLTSGGSISGEILALDSLEFTVALSGQHISLPRDSLLLLLFRCSIDAAVAGP